MSKYSVVFLLVFSILLTACNNQEAVEVFEEEVVDEMAEKASEASEEETAILTMEDVFNVVGDAPDNLRYYPSQSEVEEGLFAWEDRLRENLCGQTDACGAFTRYEDVQVAGVKALKFTIRYEGRGLDDPEGFLESFHYSLLKDVTIHRFWVSATDQEDYEALEQEFDAFMQSLSFLDSL